MKEAIYTHGEGRSTIYMNQEDMLRSVIQQRDNHRKWFWVVLNRIGGEIEIPKDDLANCPQDCFKYMKAEKTESGGLHIYLCDEDSVQWREQQSQM